MRSRDITVSLVMLMWYRSRRDTPSGIVEVVESDPDI